MPGRKVDALPVHRDRALHDRPRQAPHRGGDGHGPPRRGRGLRRGRRSRRRQRDRRARRGGRGWKLDRLGTGYLRASFDASIDQAATGALGVPAMRSCMSRQAATMPEPQLRRFMYEAMRQDPKAARTTIAIAERCPDALASYVAGQIGKVLARTGGTSAVFKCCAQREIRFQLRVGGLASQILKNSSGDIGNAALQGLALGVAAGCKRQL